MLEVGSAVDRDLGPEATGANNSARVQRVSCIGYNCLDDVCHIRLSLGICICHRACSEAAHVSGIPVNGKDVDPIEFAKEKFGTVANFLGEERPDVDLYFDSAGAPNALPDHVRCGKAGSRMELTMIGSTAYNNEDMAQVVSYLGMRGPIRRRLSRTTSPRKNHNARRQARCDYSLHRRVPGVGTSAARGRLGSAR
jgi:hypothetical protein